MLRKIFFIFFAVLLQMQNYFVAQATSNVGLLVEECKFLLGEGDFENAESVCAEALLLDIENCEARFGLLLAKSKKVSHFFSLMFYLGVTSVPLSASDIQFILEFPKESLEIDKAVMLVVDQECSLSLEKMPFLLGFEEEPFLAGEFRGTWRLQDAMFIGSLSNQASYLAKVLSSGLDTQQSTSLESGGIPSLPPELILSLSRLDSFFNILLLEPDKEDSIIRLVDTDGNGIISQGDRLEINLFVPGTDVRVLDLSDKEIFY